MDNCSGSRFHAILMFRPHTLLPFFVNILRCLQFQDEFLDVIYWSRQVLGIIIGVFWGIFPLKGFVALALYVLLHLAATVSPKQCLPDTVLHIVVSDLRQSTVASYTFTA